MEQIKVLIPQITAALSPVVGGLNENFEISIRFSNETEYFIDLVQKGGKLQILLPEGDIIQGKNDIETLLLGIKKAGVEDVAGLNILCNKQYPLVSREIIPKYVKEQKELLDGYLVFTHTSADDKRKELIEISERLKKGWSVNII